MGEGDPEGYPERSFIQNEGDDLNENLGEGSVNGQEAGRTVHEESTTPNERRSGVGSSTDVVF